MRKTHKDFIKLFRRMIDGLPPELRKGLISMISDWLKFQKEMDLEECKRGKEKQKSLL